MKSANSAWSNQWTLCSRAIMQCRTGNNKQNILSGTHSDVLVVHPVVILKLYLTSLYLFLLQKASGFTAFASSGPHWIHAFNTSTSAVPLPLGLSASHVRWSLSNFNIMWDHLLRPFHMTIHIKPRRGAMTACCMWPREDGEVDTEYCSSESCSSLSTVQ